MWRLLSNLASFAGICYHRCEGKSITTDVFHRPFSFRFFVGINPLNPPYQGDLTRFRFFTGFREIFATGGRSYRNSGQRSEARLETSPAGMVSKRRDSEIPPTVGSQPSAVS